MKNKYHVGRFGYLLIGGLITLIGSMLYFNYQKNYEEKKYKEYHSLQWTVKNGVTTAEYSFLWLFHIYNKNFLYKEIQLLNSGSRPLHNVYVKMVFAEKIIAHTYCENTDVIPFYDYNKKIISDAYVYKGQSHFNISFDQIPPHTTRTVIVVLDKEAINDSEKELLIKKNSIEGLLYKSVYSDETEGDFIDNIQ